jgi:hypothetical protein
MLVVEGVHAVAGAVGLAVAVVALRCTFTRVDPTVGRMCRRNEVRVTGYAVLEWLSLYVSGCRYR